jgi:hypothetical protein
MRPCGDRRATKLLLSALPSYLPHYEQRAASLGNELSAAAVFADLGAEVDTLLARTRDHKDEARLEAVLDAIETVLADPRVDARRLVVAFVSALSPSARSSVDAYLRPVTAVLFADDADFDAEFDPSVSRAAPLPLRSRPRRYSGRGRRKRRRL